MSLVQQAVFHDTYTVTQKHVRTADAVNIYAKYTVSKKKTSTFFYFCDIFVRCHPILLILGRNIPPDYLKQTHIHNPPHLVKIQYVLL